MLKLYKKAYYLTIVLMVIGIFAVIGVFASVLDKPSLGVIFGLLYSFSISLVAEMIATTKHNKLITNLHNNCKMREFLNEYGKLAANAAGSYYALNVSLNLFFAYFNLGEFDRARGQIFSLSPKNGNSLADAIINFVFFMNLFEAHACKGEYDLAEQALDEAERVIANPKIGRFQKEGFSRNIYTNRMKLNTLRGNFDGAEEAFSYALSNAASLIEMVGHSQMLAICLDHNGKKDEARERLKFIIENGGDTFYVDWAKNALKNME